MLQHYSNIAVQRLHPKQQQQSTVLGFSHPPSGTSLSHGAANCLGTIDGMGTQKEAAKGELCSQSGKELAAKELFISFSQIKKA